MPLPGRPRTGRLLLGAPVPWWRRSRRRVWRWLLAVSLAAVAMVIVAVRENDATRTLSGLGRSRAVVVARRDLEPGRLIGDDDTMVRALPVDAVPDRAIERVPVGRTVTAAIVAGEVVSASRLSPDGVTGLAAQVPPGRRAIAIPVEGSALRVQIDDRVDVLDPAGGQGYAGGASGPSEIVARAAIVVDVGVGESTITVAVEQDEAAPVAGALAHGAPVLALAGGEPDP